MSMPTMDLKWGVRALVIIPEEQPMSKARKFFRGPEWAARTVRIWLAIRRRSEGSRIEGMRSEKYIGVILILLGLLVYVPGLGKDLPYTTNSDEGLYFVGPAVQILQAGKWDANYFRNPAGTVIVPLVGIFAVMSKALGQSPQQAYTNHLVLFFLTARAINVGYGIMSLIGVYLIGKRVHSAKVGAAAAVLVAFTPLAVGLTRIARTDGTAVFWGVMMVWRLLKYGDDKRLRNLIWLGLCIGLGMATQYYMVGFALAAAVWLGLKGERKRVATLVVVALSVFGLVVPFLIIHWQDTWKVASYEVNHANAAADGLSQAGNFWWYVSSALPQTLSWPGYLAALVGMIIVMGKKRPEGMVLGLFVVMHVLAISVSSLHWQKYVLQIVPLMWLCAAWGSAELIKNRYVYWLGLIGAIVVPAVMIGLDRATPDTRMQAREWVLANLPKGSLLAQEYYSAVLVPEVLESPMGVYRVNDLVVSEQFSLAENGSVANLACRGFDYVMTSSDVYGRFYDQGNKYPLEINFYEELKSDTRLIKEFGPKSFESNSPRIAIYKINKSVFNCY